MHFMEEMGFFFSSIMFSAMFPNIGYHGNKECPVSKFLISKDDLYNCLIIV